MKVDAACLPDDGLARRGVYFTDDIGLPAPLTLVTGPTVACL
ncbi:hypothetical protein BN135_1262 [Cronobacter muytjensii 530]